MTAEQEPVDPDVVDENVDARTGEVVPYTPPAAPTSWTPRRTGRELAMMNRDTDSWTVVVRDVGYLASQIAHTEMVPKVLRGNPAAVTAVILHGRELGLAPMTALSLTHVIEGRTAITAEGMRGVILDDGHELRFVESTASSCTLAGRRKGTDQWTQVTWTMADAQRAGLAQKAVWKNYGRRMLQARATSELAQMMFPDVIHGLRTTEELEDMSDLADAPPAGPAPAAAPTSTVRRERPATRGAKAAEPPADTSSSGTSDEGAKKQEPPAPAAAAPSARRAAPPPRTRGSRAAAGDGGGATPPAATDPAPEAAPDGPAEGKGGPVGIPQSADRTDPPMLDDTSDDEDGEPGEAEPTAEPVLPAVDETPREVELVTSRQRGTIMAECNRFGLEDRTERLAYLQTIADRDAPLTTTHELTKVEASLILDRMAACKTRDELDQRVMNR